MVKQKLDPPAKAKLIYSEHHPYFGAERGVSNKYCEASHVPQKADPDKPPRYAYRVKLEHADGRIEKIILSSYDDKRAMVQIKEFADIMACTVLKIWGKREMPPPPPDKPPKAPYNRFKRGK